MQTQFSALRRPQIHAVRVLDYTRYTGRHWQVLVGVSQRDPRSAVSYFVGQSNLTPSWRIFLLTSYYMVGSSKNIRNSAKF